MLVFARLLRAALLAAALATLLLPSIARATSQPRCAGRVATIVGTAAVYSTFGAAFLSGSPAAGAAIGAAFGLARAVMVLPAGRVRLPAQLGRLDARLRAMDGPSRRVAVSCQVGLAAACLVIALG